MTSFQRCVPCSACAALVFAFSVGCSNDAPPPKPPPRLTAKSSAPANTLKVALVHPGRENDRGWNQLAYEALQSLEARGKAAIKHVYSPTQSNFKSDLRALAEQGYDLVICHGGEYAKSARAVAPQFAKTHFVVTGSDEAGDGVATLDFRLWEATYLCGILAAKVVPDGPAGLIGAQDVRTVHYTLDAFANGARSVRPDYATQMQYVGSWDDVAKAQQTARSLIDGYKVRVLFQNCDSAAFGVFQAARDAKILAFGSNSDQAAAAPEQVLASAVIDMAEAFAQAAETVRAGRFEGKAVTHDLKSGGIRFVANPKLKDRWPADAAEAIRAAQDAIVAGKLDVLKSAAAP